MESSIKFPYFDKRIIHDKDILINCNMQKIMALFISNPINYQNVFQCSPEYKHSVFFNLFVTFYNLYITLNVDKVKDFDICVYFRCLNTFKKGTVNITGESGKISHCAKREFIGRFNESQKKILLIKNYLSQKYGFDFNQSKPDPRIFIGHQEIWMNPSPELLKKENLEWVITQSYDDETFTKPFPDILDKDLIPLKIRNKVIQKWKTMRNNKLFKLPKDKIDEDEEEEYEEDSNNKKKENTVEKFNYIIQCSNEEW